MGCHTAGTEYNPGLFAGGNLPMHLGIKHLVPILHLILQVLIMDPKDLFL